MATFLEVIFEAARLGRYASTGTCSALGTTTRLEDVLLRDHGIDVKYQEGAWIYRPDAALAADTIRRVKESGFTVASGFLDIDRAWTNAPANDEVYYLFTLAPPYRYAGVSFSWADAVNRGFQEIYAEDEVVLGRGDGSGNPEIPIRSPSTIPAMMLLGVAVDGTPTVTQPTGFAVISDIDDADGRFRVFAKLVNPADPVEFDMTLDAAEECAAIAAVYRGADPDTTLTEVIAFAESTTEGASPGITPLADNSLIARFLMASGTRYPRWPSDVRERADTKRGQLITPSAESAHVALADEDAETTAAVADKTVAYADSTPAGSPGQITIALQPMRIEGTVQRVSFEAAAVRTSNGAVTTLGIPNPAREVDDWLPEESDIRKVFLRQYRGSIAIDQDMDKLGRFWRFNGRGVDAALWLSQAPTTEQDVVLQVVRPQRTLSDDGDLTRLRLEHAGWGGTWQMMSYFNRVSNGRFATELAFAKLEFDKENRRLAPRVAVRGV